MKTLVAILAMLFVTAQTADARHRKPIHISPPPVTAKSVDYNRVLDLGACPIIPYAANHDMLCYRQEGNP